MRAVVIPGTFCDSAGQDNVFFFVSHGPIFDSLRPYFLLNEWIYFVIREDVAIIIIAAATIKY